MKVHYLKFKSMAELHALLEKKEIAKAVQTDKLKAIDIVIRDVTKEIEYRKKASGS